MRLLLHAITTADPLPHPPPGLRGGALVRLDWQALSAWATPVADDAPPLGRDDLLAAHALVSALHDNLSACLPARFPTLLADDAAATRWLAERADDLAHGLGRVRGRVELALTGVWTLPAEDSREPLDDQPPGTRYLVERRQAFAGSDRRRQRAAELADGLERLAGGDLVETQRQLCPSARLAFSMALLVPRAAAADVSARITRPQADVRILVSGPWPPYTFASGV